MEFLENNNNNNNNSIVYLEIRGTNYLQILNGDSGLSLKNPEIYKEFSTKFIFVVNKLQYPETY